MENRSLPVRIASFLIAVTITWVVCFQLAPMLVENVPAMKKMADFVDESGIETGEFYYTDVEIVGHADLNARSSIEYLPHGPVPEKRKDEQEKPEPSQ